MAIKIDKKISASEFAKHFSEQVKDADSVYTESLHRLARIRSSRQGHQKRQLKDMLKSYGETDARVVKQAVRIIREQEMENYTNIVLDKNSIDTELITDSYVLRGKVRGDNSKGLAGYSVQLHDAKNNVIGEPVKTDVNGNYSIIVDIKEGESIKKLNVAVLDKQNTLIHSDKLPVLLKSDVVDTRDIILTKIDETDRSDEWILKDVLTPGNTKLRKTKVIPKETAIKNAPTKKVTKKLTPRTTGKKSPK